MGCCQAGRTVDDAEGEPQEELSPITTEVVVSKTKGTPLAIQVDPSTLRITNCGEFHELRNHVGWVVGGVDFARSDILRHIHSEETRNAARVTLLLNNPDVRVPIPQAVMTITKDPAAKLGVKFRSPQLLIIDKVWGPAAQHGMAHYEGWKVTHIDGTPVATAQELGGHAADKGTLTLKLMEVTLLPSEKAALRIKKCFMLFRERRRIEWMMFRLILRDLEIQEECELNMLDPGLDAGWDAYRKVIADRAPHLVAGRPTHVPSPRLQEIINQILSTGERPADPREVLGILREAEEQCRQRDNVHRIKVPNTGTLAVVGDLHGQLADLAYILKQFGTPSPNKMYLFNGDFVDRGKQGMEVVLVICSLMLLYPGCVFANRGNHEDAYINAKYGFGEECAVMKYNLGVYDAVQRLFRTLPLMHVARKVAVCHGGLPGITGLQISEINAIDRAQAVPRTSPNLQRWQAIFQGLLWSDPKEDLKSAWTKSQRGAGVYFSRAVTESFLQTNQLALLVRSHQTVENGTKTQHDGLIHTVFSASCYRGKGRNRGAVILLQWEGGVFQGATNPSWSGEDKHAMSQRLGDLVATDEDAKVGPKHDVLQRAMMLIFQRKADIQSCLQALDTTEQGSLTRAQFVLSLQQVLPHMPWWVLCKHLVDVNGESTISYNGFLNRFQNEISRRWGECWGALFLPHVLLRIGTCIDDIELHFKGIDDNKSSKLSYQEFYLFLTRRMHLRNLGPLHVFHIIHVIDSNQDGFIDLHEFKRAFQERYEAVRRDPEANNEVYRVWEARASNPEAYLRFMDEFRAVEDSRGREKDKEKVSKKSKKEKKRKRAKGVALGEFVDLGIDILGGSRSAWKNTGKLLMKDSSTGDEVRLKFLQRRVKRLGQLNDDLESVSRWIRTISGSKLSVRAIFQSIDSTGTGRITKEQFHMALKLLKLPTDTSIHLWDCLDVNGDGYVTLAEFVGCLEVRDYGLPLGHPLGPTCRVRHPLSVSQAPLPGGYPRNLTIDGSDAPHRERREKKRKDKKRPRGDSDASSDDASSVARKESRHKEKKSKKSKKEKKDKKAKRAREARDDSGTD